jgi:RNA polymerase sigma factor (sigma-70 family)
VDAVTRPARAASHPRWWLRARGDERLVALVRTGDAAAFEAIYDRYHARILAFCRHMLGSREDAEDAAQYTFIGAYHDLLRSARDVDLKPWLYAIARNRCLSMLRSRRDTKSAEDGVEPATEGLADVVQRRQDLRELLADLNQLPDDQRAALVLFELDDMSQTEIAGVLDREPAQVKALVFQARTTLMQYREARAMDCAAIREELAVARGPALLRGHLRRHLRVCPACSEYAKAVRHQRAALGLLLPVIPTAGLKAAVMGAGPGAAGGGGLGVLAFAGAKGIGLKVLALVTAAGVVGAGVEVAQHEHGHHSRARPAAPGARQSSQAKPAAGASTPVARPAAVTPAAVGRSTSSSYKRSGHERRRRHAAAGAGGATKAPLSSSSVSATGTPPKSTPVKGAKRQSTGHAQKSRRRLHSHKPAAPPGQIKTKPVPPGQERVPPSQDLTTKGQTKPEAPAETPTDSTSNGQTKKTAG